jgi:hypothetical protein
VGEGRARKREGWGEKKKRSPEVQKDVKTGDTMKMGFKRVARRATSSIADCVCISSIFKMRLLAGHTTERDW